MISGSIKKLATSKPNYCGVDFDKTLCNTDLGDLLKAVAALGYFENQNKFKELYKNNNDVKKFFETIEEGMTEDNLATTKAAWIKDIEAELKVFTESSNKESLTDIKNTLEKDDDQSKKLLKQKYFIDKISEKTKEDAKGQDSEAIKTFLIDYIKQAKDTISYDIIKDILPIAMKSANYLSQNNDESIGYIKALYDNDLAGLINKPLVESLNKSNATYYVTSSNGNRALMTLVISVYNATNVDDKINHKAIINGVYKDAQNEGLTRPIFKILNLMTAIESGTKDDNDINTLIKSCPFTKMFAEELIKENELRKTNSNDKQINSVLAKNQFGPEIKELQAIFNEAFKGAVTKYFDESQNTTELSTKEKNLKDIVSNLYLLDDHHKTTCIATENEGCFYKVLHKPEYKTKDGIPITDQSKIFGHEWAGLDKQYDHSKNIYDVNKVIESSLLIAKINNIAKSLNENANNLVKQNPNGTFNINKQFAQNLYVSSFVGKNKNYNQIDYQTLLKLVDDYIKKCKAFDGHVTRIQSGQYRNRTALQKKEQKREGEENSRF